MMMYIGLDLQPGAVGFTMTTTPCLDVVTLIASLNVRGVMFNRTCTLSKILNINGHQ